VHVEVTIEIPEGQRNWADRAAAEAEAEAGASRKRAADASFRPPG